MSVFCLLWIPLFYFFRRSITASSGGKAFWAFLLGCAAVIIRFFAGFPVSPGGFGLSRWMSGFIDIVSLPVIVPLAVSLLLVLTGAFPRETDHAGFVMVWLIPVAAYRSVIWSSSAFPHLLILVPLLWTAQCIVMTFFVNFIFKYRRWYITVVSTLGAAAVPIIAATCWWAFFSQQTLYGFILLFVSLIPAAVPMIVSFAKNGNKIDEDSFN
jgi:hypothetical protein